MANFLTPLNLCNQALRLFGDNPVTSLSVTGNSKVNTFNEHYNTLRDELLESHFWNWATVRTTIAAYSQPAATLTPAATTGSGILFTTSTTGIFGLDAVGMLLQGNGVPGSATIVGLVTSSPVATLTPGTGALSPGATGVIFTASAAVLAAGDVGKLIENLAGVGVARITAFTDTTHVVATIVTAFEALTAIASGAWRLVRTDQVTADIGQAFAAITPIAAGAWRLYNQSPDWGFQYRLALPADYLRIQRIRRSAIYQREGDFFVSNQESLPLTYTRRVTDITRWPAFFVSAFVAAMVAKMVEPGTGQRAKQVDWFAIADAKLRRAKLLDGMEGSSQIIRASDLADARLGMGPVYTTEE